MVEIPKNYGNFHLLKTLKLSYADVTISKWKSRITGLSVVHVDYPGTVVRCGLGISQLTASNFSSYRDWTLRSCN
jgi:hypothetical protein